MAKDRERSHARVLYVDKGKTAKQIALEVGVNENTIGKWIEKFNWKKDKAAKILNKESREENIIEIIGSFAAERLELQKDVKTAIKAGDKETANEIRKQIAQIDDSVSKWNKTYETIKKESEISQLVMINVADIIFKHFDSRYPHLQKESTEFQEIFISEIVELYGK